MPKIRKCDECQNKNLLIKSLKQQIERNEDYDYWIVSRFLNLEKDINNLMSKVHRFHFRIDRAKKLTKVSDQISKLRPR